MVKRKPIVESESESEEEKEYQVQDILASKQVFDRTYYLIQWVGFARQHNTWENAKHVFCEELVRKFNKKQSTDPAYLKSIFKEFPFPESYLDENYKSDPEEEEEEEEEEEKEEEVKATRGKKQAKTTRGSTPSTPALPKAKPNAKAKPKGKKAAETKEEKANDKGKSGFSHGDTVEVILGCKVINQVLSFYVKWNGKESFSYVPNNIMRDKEPQKLIDFYQSRIQFGKKSNDEAGNR